LALRRGGAFRETLEGYSSWLKAVSGVRPRWHLIRRDWIELLQRASLVGTLT
jgi:hypothetical protein